MNIPTPPAVRDVSHSQVKMANVRQFGNCNSRFGDPNHSKMIVELIQKIGL